MRDKNCDHVHKCRRLILIALNPDEHTTHETEADWIAQEANTLREMQGLQNDQPMYNGFITRGSPMRHLQSIATKLHHQRRKLQEANKLL